MFRFLILLALLLLGGENPPVKAAPPPRMKVQLIVRGRYEPAEIDSSGSVIHDMKDEWSWRGYDRWLPPGRYLCGNRIVFRYDPASKKWLEVPGRQILYNPGTLRLRVERVTLDD